MIGETDTLTIYPSNSLKKNGTEYTRICKPYSRLLSVRKNNDFRLIYHKGRSYSLGSMVLYVNKNSDKTNHLGVSVSAKSGNSVTRHRFQRIVREVFRLNQNKIADGFDFVIVMKKNNKIEKTSLITYREIEKTILCMLDKMKVLKKQQ